MRLTVRYALFFAVVLLVGWDREKFGDGDQYLDPAGCTFYVTFYSPWLRFLCFVVID